MVMQTKFKLNQRDSVWFHENSGQVNQAYAKNVCDIAILPIGAIEQHGPHCPCGSDTFNAIGIAERVAEKTGAMILPSPMYGSHPHHHWGMPGTIPLKYETHIALLEDIVRGAAVAGFNKFIIISAHGQVSSMIVAVHKLGIEGYFTISSTWYDFLRDNKEVLKDFMWHADEAETSVALHLYPEHLNMDLAEKGGGHGLVDSKWKIAPGQAAMPGMMYHFEGTFALPEKDDLDNGVIGDPTHASVEKGEALVGKCVDYYVELLEEIKSKYPCGINPLGFRNPLGYEGTAAIEYDKDHDDKGQLK
ncbi:MAG: creatininase family protein [Eubacterium aggregans]|uniref:Creatinine amidohydrolase n=1 Tax=Eubacterium aggregans TaxID=81409 RepID=A0A1H4AR11_9FIRM|nr:creatininase family protein [Eubacterium aggregans]MDD4691898.1 creatininase family protein [Eubacterium aggregans]MEA5073748.1 creatininase family protein [Eubacterium aggregans]SEA38355.1 creatinine amidohydrolase [Eubacterium aggregans]